MKEKSLVGWYFLGIVTVVIIVTALFRNDLFLLILDKFGNIIKNIYWVLIVVFALMFLVNYFVTPKLLLKHMQRKKGWLISVVAGIISTGPIYLWYPLMSDLKDKRVKVGYLATFLYSRAIKPALIPLMIFYFGLIYTIILTVLTILASLLQGAIIDKVMEVRK